MDDEKKRKKRETIFDQPTNKFVPLRDAVRYTGINAQTIRKLADQQKIRSYKTLTGQRKFDKQHLEELCGCITNNQNEIVMERKNYIYARVSTRKQMDDLERQIEYIKSQREEYGTYEVISDVASGINFNRKGLSKLLDLCLQDSIGKIVVAHRDRLARFGFELIKSIVEKKGGELVVLSEDENKSSEQELAEDLLSIVHIFTCRQMGKRSYKKKITEVNPETEENDRPMDSDI